MEVRGTKDWVSLLKECVHTINNRKHNSTGFKPVDIDFSNAGVVFSRLYPKLAQNLQPAEALEPKFELGDKVRVLDRTLLTAGFSKGDTARGSRDVYIIGRILFGYVIRYNLKNPVTDTFIAGSYQESELVLAG